MSNTVLALFFISWLICGCCLDGMFADLRVFIIAVIALVVALCCMFRMVKEELLSERW